MCICSFANGGGSWKATAIAGHDRSIDCLVFIDDMIGWACANFPGVYKTEDGGTTWIKQNSNLDKVSIYAAWFIDSYKGWAVGWYRDDNGFLPCILKTADGGRSWITQEIFKQGGGLHSIFFIDDRHGWAAGSTRENRAWITRTLDGGEKWEMSSQDINNIDLHNIRFHNVLCGWVVGQSGVLHTDDGGQSWVVQGFRDKPLLNGLAVINPETAWVTGQGLYRTTDGGLHWSKIALPKAYEKLYFHNIAFNGNNEGWICGEKGVVLSTQNGGANWNNERMGVDGFLGPIALTNSKIFIGGTKGRIFSKIRGMK